MKEEPIKNKHDVEEFSKWVEEWLNSRTREWWDEFANEFNEGRPEEDWIILKHKEDERDRCSQGNGCFYR